MQKTKIPYLTHTWNPIAMRCTPVSAGCANCWHIKMANRMAAMPWPDTRAMAYAGKCVSMLEKELEAPLYLRKPAVIGVQFMGDLFHDSVPDEFIGRVLNIIYECSYSKFLVLTKRPQRMFDFICRSAFMVNDRFMNLWLGVSVEDQTTADERIRLLLQTPAAKRFVSYEPAVGPVNFNYLPFAHSELERYPKHYSAIQQQHDDCYYQAPSLLDWIIMGGESGPGARPMHPDWARSVRDQCKAANVPFFFKQWGEYLADDIIKVWNPKGTDEPYMRKLGTKRAGRLLDGKEYLEMPQTKKGELSDEQR